VKDIMAKQSIPQHLRYSFEDFLRQFPNDDACLEHIKEQRWPSGITYCEKCKSDKKHHRVTDRTAYACETCGWHIYPPPVRSGKRPLPACGRGSMPCT